MVIWGIQSAIPFSSPFCSEGVSGCGLNGYHLTPPKRVFGALGKDYSVIFRDNDGYIQHVQDLKLHMGLLRDFL